MEEFEDCELSCEELEILEEIQSKISYCVNCQPYDSGEPVWIHGERVDLDDFFSEYDLLDESIDSIKHHLCCPYCGHEDMSCDDEVGIQSVYEKKEEDFKEEVLMRHETDFKQLLQLIEKNPLLVCRDPLAQEIFNEIENKKFPMVSIKGNFYRVRKVENSMILNSNELNRPPLGIPSEGRFNHSGQSHLYLANDLATGTSEILGEDSSQLIWSQEFKIINEVSNILDLSYSYGDFTMLNSAVYNILVCFSDSVYKDGGNQNNWKPDYFLTRYIMDCAKYCGYNGIKYNSTKNDLGFNIVLFFPENIKLEPINRPNIKISEN